MIRGEKGLGSLDILLYLLLIDESDDWAWIGLGFV